LNANKTGDLTVFSKFINRLIHLRKLFVTGYNIGKAQGFKTTCEELRKDIRKRKLMKLYYNTINKQKHIN